MSTLQDGKTLGENKSKTTFSMGPIIVTAKDSNDVAILPNLEISYTKGILDHLDFSIGYAFLTTVNAGVKVGLIDSKSVGVSTGLNTSFSYYGNWGSVTEIGFPLYLSCHFKKDIALYGSPKYLLSITSDGSLVNALGQSVGIKLGKEMAFLFECSFLQYLNSDAALIQFSVGGAF